MYVSMQYYPIQGHEPLTVGNPFIIPAKVREYVFTGVCLCVSVCLSVTTINTKLWTDLHQILWEGFYGEREDRVRVSL